MSLVSPEAPKSSSLIVLLAQEDANVRAVRVSRRTQRVGHGCGVCKKEGGV